MRFRKIQWGSWWRLGELCEVPRCLLWRGLKRHCPMYKVSYFFFNKCFYFLYYVAGSLLNIPCIWFYCRHFQTETEIVKIYNDLPWSHHPAWTIANSWPILFTLHGNGSLFFLILGGDVNCSLKGERELLLWRPSWSSGKFRWCRHLWGQENDKQQSHIIECPARAQRSRHVERQKRGEPLIADRAGHIRKE